MLLQFASSLSTLSCFSEQCPHFQSLDSIRTHGVTRRIMEEICGRARRLVTHLNAKGSLERKWMTWLNEPGEFEWVQDLKELATFCEIKGVSFDRSDHNGTVRRLYERLQEEVSRKGENMSEVTLWDSLTRPSIEKARLLLRLKPFHPISIPSSEYCPAADAANPFAIHRTLSKDSFDDPVNVTEGKGGTADSTPLSLALLDRYTPSPSRYGRIQKSFTDFPETEQAKAIRNRQMRSQHIGQVLFSPSSSPSLFLSFSLPLSLTSSFLLCN